MSTSPGHPSADLELGALRGLAKSPTRHLGRGLVILLLLFVLPLLAAGIWIYWEAERELSQSELNRDLLRARSLAALVQRKFLAAETVLTAIERRQLFRRAWAARDLRGLERHLREIREFEPAFFFVGVYERDGTLRAILPPAPIVGQNFAHRDWFRGVASNWQPYVSEIYSPAVAPNPLVVAVAVPIHDEQGRPAGILVAPYALDALERRFEALEAGSVGAPCVLDQRGVVVTAPGFCPAGQSLRGPEQAAVARALAGEEGAGRFGSGSQEAFVGYAPVPRLGWAVIYRRPATQALAAVYRLRRQALTTGFYLLLVYLGTAGIATVLVSRQETLLAANQRLNEALEERITERKRAEEELDRFFTLSLDMLCIAGFDGYFKRLNPAWETTLGFTREELLAKPYLDFVHPDDREATLAEAEKIVGGAVTLRFENRYRSKDGSYRWFLWTASPFAGQELIYAGARDITERKQAEEALRVAKEEADRAAKFKDQFLSTMSHELRTPLNAVLGFSELLFDERFGALTDRQRRYLDHIRTGGQHLLKLINDILDLSKIEAGRMEVAIENVRVAPAFDEVLSVLRPLADKKSQTLSHLAPPELAVRADATRFKQVLMNLVGNAIKFTPEGGRIELLARRANGAVRVEVRDTGPGIPPDEQRRIFDAFYRLRKSGEGPEGTGLGLAITQRLVELQGGKLGLESQPGQGSCFYFSLPAVGAPLAPSVQKSPAVSSTASVPRILVIEDDPLAAQLVQYQLISAGYEPVICLQSEHATELATKLQPQAITLDLLMEPTNGWEVLLQLKSDARTTGIPVVVLTIVDAPAIGATLGADEYLVKPVERAALLAAIERCLGARGALSPEQPILVVEDDAATREVICALLTANGFAVASAADGAQARSSVAASLPALVILDLILPEVTGFELLAEWRADPRTADLPIFVLTSKDLTREEEGFLRGHAESVFHKQQRWQEDLLKQLRRVAPNERRETG